ncbi:hypothetical protein HUU53_00210 [Candidatus Micrarchaeota archaeon]|nr:hypothetical protein [Candidatus Micrarchaeota archaeon]
MTVVQPCPENIEKTPELAYVIGTMQGDGSFCECKIKGKKYKATVLTIEAMDLEMIEQTRNFFEKSFGRKVAIFRKTKGSYGIRYLVKGLLSAFQKLELDFTDPPKPPKWVEEKTEFFGAYLAGVIDSDGNVCIKRPTYPMCQIKITSGTPQIKLQEAVKNNLKCGTNIDTVTDFNKTWKKWTTRSNLRFVISKKNLEVIKKFVLPYLTIPRKRNKISEYIETRYKAG